MNKKIYDKADNKFDVKVYLKQSSLEQEIISS